MELIRSNTKIDFVGKKTMAIAMGLSLACILATVVFLIANGGLQYGVDFAGGTLVHVKFARAIDAGAVRSTLETMNISVASVQGLEESGDSEFLIRTSESTSSMDDLGTRIKQNLDAAHRPNTVEIRRVEMVGPKVGRDLREKALLALFSALLLVAVYISGRFELKWMASIIMSVALLVTLFFLQSVGVSIAVLIYVALAVTLGLFYFLKLRFAMGAIVALIHDVVITVGALVLTGREFTLTTIAALLTIIGYSLNDSIVVYDRIRETVPKYSKKSYREIVNISINETLSRTLLTSTGTMVMVISLFFLGGGIIHDFAFALIVGIIVGTYSSIYVASPILILWNELELRKKS